MISRIKDGIHAVNGDQAYDTLVNSARRRVPEKDTFMAAHWKLFYVSHGSDTESLERFWGNVPNKILAKTVELVSQ